MSWLRRLLGDSSDTSTASVDYLAEALALESAGDIAGATTSYRLALRDRPDDPKVLQNFAILLSKTGQPDEAIRQYRKALAADPSLAGAHYGVGFLLLKRGVLPEAITHLEAFVRLQGGRDDAASARWVAHAEATLAQLRERVAASGVPLDAPPFAPATLER
jgi:tetratricopeptide (TPR) repeat protein